MNEPVKITEAHLLLLKNFSFDKNYLISEQDGSLKLNYPPFILDELPDVLNQILEKLDIKEFLHNQLVSKIFNYHHHD